MSRLESFIRRLQAQRQFLNEAMAEIAGMDGVALELGLGNGRTYDHLRNHMPDRPIYVFERMVRAHPDCIPPDDHLFLGDVVEQLGEAARKLGPSAILVHSDIGTGDEAGSQDFGRRILGPALQPLLAPGARVVSDQPLGIPGALELPKPPDIDPDRCYLYRYEG